MKKSFREHLKNVFEPFTKTIENTSQDITKAVMETSNNNNKAPEKFNNKTSRKKNDRDILATSLMNRLSKITTPENTSQFKSIKNSNSNRVNDLLIHNTIPITLYHSLFTFRDTGKEF